MKKKMNSAFKAAVMMTICVLTLGFTSCSSDDDPAYSDPNLLGTWLVNQLTTDEGTVDATSANMTLTFTEDGKCIIVTGEGNNTVKYKMKNKTITIYESGEITGSIEVISLNETSATFDLKAIDDTDFLRYTCSKQ